jgi:TM2 domain-containing membrane protein YozV
MAKQKEDIEEDDDDDMDEKPLKKKGGGGKQESKRMTAALLALFLGGFGAHKFFLGYQTAGIIQFLTCGGCGLAFVEGIIYLMKKDDEFIETYQIGKKPWL